MSMDISLIENLTQELQDMVLLNLSLYDINKISKDKVSEYVWLRKKDETIKDAAKNGNLIGLKYLIEECNANIYDEEKALEIAAENGHIDVIIYLYKQFADIIDRLRRSDSDYDEYAEYTSALNYTKTRALILSSTHGYLDIVKYLVEECNADIHGYGEDNYEEEALLMSIKRDHFEVVKYLIEKGAIFQDFHDEFGILQMIANNGNLEMMKYLVKNGLCKNEALYLYALRNNFEMVKYLIEQGANINYDNGITLRVSAERDRFEMVKYLVEHGANINVHGGGNNPAPLVSSAENGNLEMVKYLVEHGANVNIAKNEALLWSAARGDLEMVKYLVEHGAKVNANKDEALEIAIQTKQLLVVEYLRKQMNN
jgi:ankyrin repeat protein